MVGTRSATLLPSSLWKGVDELKVYFMNEDEIKTWKYEGRELSVATIFSWVKFTWNVNAKNYPKFSITSQQSDAHIRVKFDCK